MGPATYRIDGLPGSALAAAAQFHQEHLPAIERQLADVQVLTVVFPAAAYDHRAWRSAAIADMARQHAPARVNGIAGDESDALTRAAAWLASAPGITGQYFAVDGAGPQAALV